MKKLVLLVALVITSALGAFAQGSGGAVDFGPNAGSDNHISLGALPLGTTDFTVEFWYKAAGVGSDPSIFSNKDWGSGSNTGLNIAIQGGGSNIDINFKGDTGPRVDMNITSIDFTTGWNHIAISFDRDGDMTAYVNGINVVSTSIAGSVGDLSSVYPFNVGQDGTGTYGGQIEGQMDDLRIWNDIRTETEIRESMCVLLAGNEAGLIAYYPFEDVSGTVATDLTGTYDGTWQNSVPANWTVSGAYLGDVSDFDYATNWTGVSQSLSGNSGVVTLDNYTGTLEGVHLFRVDAVPVAQNGISTLLSNDEYYGVFLVGASGASAYLTYDYSTYNEAVTNENSILLYERSDNSATVWSDAVATVNTGADEVNDVITASGELILGFSTGICNDPTSFQLVSTQINDATLSWSSTAASFELEYGPSGFTPGSGTTVTTSVNPFMLSNLTPGTNYDVYLTADCGGGLSSNQVGPVSFTTMSVPSNQLLGSAMALDLDGSNDWVNLSNGKVSAASLGLPNDQITVECWAFVRDYTTWNAIVSFLQDNGSFEKGWDIETRDGNKFAFALSTNGTLTYMETLNEFAINRWYHLAATYDGTTQRLYVNGSLEAESTVNSGLIDYDDSWLSVGAYKDDNEEIPFDGRVDELRIWDTAKSPADIQDLMCEKLVGNESGLVLYYRFDEQTGTTVSEENGTVVPGTMENMDASDHVVSGAPLGDDSEHIHDAADWSVTTVGIGSTADGSVSVNNISGQPNGVHVYRVNGVPDTDPLLPALMGTNDYFGVFVAESNQSALSNYVFEWDYGSYTDAMTNENDLLLLNRTKKTNPIWAVNSATVNTTADVVVSDTLSFRKEFVLGTDNNISCTLPSGLNMTNQTPDTVDIAWINGGSGISNVQWGEVGFTVGQGTFITDITSEEAILGPLTQDVIYEVYVQDSCAVGNSPWIGPFIVTGEACLSPTNIMVTNIGASSVDIDFDGVNGSTWTISWGQPGFIVDWGVQSVATSIPYTLSGLAEETTYEFYIRSDCPSAESQWVGPFQFTTGNSVSLDEQYIETAVYPNPSKGTFHVLSRALIHSVSITNLAGQSVPVEVTLNGTAAFVKASSQKGFYLMRLETANGTTVRRIEIM